MGQKLANVNIQFEFKQVILPFCGLSNRTIELIWKKFNEISDGFGIPIYIFIEMLSISCVLEEMNISSLQVLQNLCKDLFITLDTDQNQLIDALEVTSCIAMISGMKMHEILGFIFMIFDLNGDHALNMDEVILALKTLRNGLNKITIMAHNMKSNEMEDENRLFEKLVYHVFQSECIGSKLNDLTRINIHILINRFTTIPDIQSWYIYYSNPSFKKYDECAIRRHNREEIRRVDGSGQCQWELSNRYCDYYENSMDANDIITSKLKPSSFKSIKKGINKGPSYSLEISWVYGYESQRCQGNLFYNIDGYAVYSIGKLIVVFDIEKCSQRVFTNHINIVNSMHIHPKKLLICSSDYSKDCLGSFLIWNSQTFEVLYSEKLHDKEIKSISFSKDGSNMAILQLNRNPMLNLNAYSFSIFSLISYTNIYSTILQSEPSCILYNIDDTIVIGGEEYLYFWVKDSYCYSQSIQGFEHRTLLNGIFLRNESISNVITTLACGGLTPGDGKTVLYCGTSNGNLLQFVDRNCKHRVLAHTGAINQLYADLNTNIMISCCINDITMKLWNISRFEVKYAIQITTYTSSSHIINAISLSSDATTLLFSTKASKVFEISAINGYDKHGGPIVFGHSYGKINIGCFAPDKSEICTGGEDGILIIWDAVLHSVLRVVQFDIPITAITFNNIGDLIVVGLGEAFNSTIRNNSEQVRREAGTFLILHAYDLTILQESRNSTKSVTILQYSPDSETLTIGYEDGSLQLCAPNEEFEIFAKVTLGSNKLTCLDFSYDSAWIRVASYIDRKIYFISADDGREQAPELMKDIHWATNTCIGHWQSKECHNNCWVNEKITCMNAITSFANALVCGTDQGYITSFSYPTAYLVQEYQRYAAHNGSITSISFSNDYKMLVTTGANDGCLIQWKVNTFHPMITNDIDDNIVICETKALIERRIKANLMKEELVESTRVDSYIQEDYNSPMIEQQVTNKCKSWIHNIITPSNANANANANANVKSPKSNTSMQSSNTLNIPSANLVLEYVYSYSSSCPIVLYGKTRNEFLFSSSSILIVMNKINKSQQYYRGHKHEISSFALTEDKLIIATGERQGYLTLGDKSKNSLTYVQSQIHISSIDTKESISIISETSKCDFTHICFSKDGVLLAYCINDEFNTISVCLWKHQLINFRSLTSRNPIIALYFIDSNELVAISTTEVFIWEIRDSLGILRKPIVTCLNSNDYRFTCSTTFMSTEGLVVSIGDSNGSLFFLERTSLKTICEIPLAHKGAIQACVSTRSNDSKLKLLVTGGCDGFCRIWHQKMIDTITSKYAYSCLIEVKIDSPISPNLIVNPIQSVDLSSDLSTSNILIGTTTGEILEFTLPDVITTKSKEAIVLQVLLTNQSSKGELTALASHPLREEFVTGGYDGSIRFFDSREFRQLKCIRTNTICNSISYSHNGKLVAGGFSALATISYSKSQSIEVSKGSKSLFKGLTKAQIVDEPIVAIEDSPQATNQLVGMIMIYSSIDYKLLFEKQLSNEPINSIRFSPDSLLLACGCEDSSILIIDVKDNYIQKFVIKQHRSPIKTLDFSSDGQFLRSVDVTEHTYYSNMSSDNTEKKNIENPIVLRDEKWATSSSCVSWEALGYWKRYGLGYETLTCIQRSWNRQLTCVGTNLGKLIFSHFPCSSPTHGMLSMKAHCNNVANIVFLPGDNRLVSIGQYDHAILQWKIAYDNTREAGELLGSNNIEFSNIREFENVLEVVSNGRISLPSDYLQRLSPKCLNELRDIFHTQASMNTTMNPNSSSFQLQMVVGLNTRGGVYYNSSDNIIYSSHHFGHIMHRFDSFQYHYTSHSPNLITTLAISSSKTIVASGELNLNASIHLWDSSIGMMLCKRDNIHRDAIISLYFSSSDEYLISLGRDNFNSIIVLRSPNHTWRDDDCFTWYCMSLTTCLPRISLDASSSSSTSSTSSTSLLWVLFAEKNEYHSIIGGMNEIYFLKRNPSDQSVSKRKGEFGKGRLIQPLLCGCLVSSQDSKEEQEILTGCASGQVYKWSSQGKLLMSITCHEQAITCIIPQHSLNLPMSSKNTSNSNALLVGGDGCITSCIVGLIKIWTYDWMNIHTIDLRKFSSSIVTCTSLALNYSCNKLLIGCQSIIGEAIHEFSLISNCNVVLAQSHSFKTMIKGIACHPLDSNEYCTVGSDGYVKIWNITSLMSITTCIKQLKLDYPLFAVQYDPLGEQLIVSIDENVKDGSYVIINTNTLTIISESRFAKKCITCIEYSPDNSRIVMTSSDGKVYFHNSKDMSLQYFIDTNMKLHDGIHNIDFSTDGKLVRMNIGAYKNNAYDDEAILYHTLDTKEIYASYKTISNNTQWDSERVPFHFNTLDIWNDVKTLGTVVSSTKAKTKNILAVSYENGEIRIYPYPCSGSSAKEQLAKTNFKTLFKVSPGIGSSRLVFTKDDKFLLVVDCIARCILVYSILD